MAALLQLDASSRRARDYIGESETWKGYRAQVDTYVSQLQDFGGNVEVIDLPVLGIIGNSHVPMMDTNSDQVADHIFDWIQRNNF